MMIYIMVNAMIESLYILKKKMLKEAMLDPGCPFVGKL